MGGDFGFGLHIDQDDKGGLSEKEATFLGSDTLWLWQVLDLGIVISLLALACIYFVIQKLLVFSNFL